MDPITAAITVAMSVADILQGIQGRINAKAIKKYKEELFKANKAAILESYHAQAAQTNVGVQQQRGQIAEEIMNVTLQGLNQRGASRASAAGAGVAGRTTMDVQLDVMTQENRQHGRLRTLQEYRETAARLSLQNLSLQAKRAILSSLPSPTPIPSPVSIAASALASGVEGFAIGQQISMGFGDGGEV